MKRLVLLTTLVALCLTHQHVQAGWFGVKGGLNFSSVPSAREALLGSVDLTDHYVQAFNDSYMGFHFGVFSCFSFGNAFIQPELLYVETGQEMVHIFGSQGSKGMQERYFTPKFSHLKLPVLAGARLGFLRLGAGPVFSLLLDNTRGHLEIPEYIDRARFNYRSSTMGYQLMAGFEIGNITLDFRYEGSLNRLGDGISVGGEVVDFDLRPRQYIISLGFVVF